MKQFDKDSIKTFFLEKLGQSVYWNNILKNSAIDNLLDVIAEREAETARYFEYLLKESKWNYAQNYYSLTSMAGFFGYKVHRKISATGTVIVSHDPALQNAGSTLFESNLDTLTPWTGASFVIPSGIQFKAGDLSFLSTRSINYKTGDKYVSVPVIQGELKTYRTLSGASGIPFERVRLLDSDVEAYTTDISKQFLSVKIFIDGDLNTEPIEAKNVDNILLAEPDEYAYDILTSWDFSYVEFRFGDGLTGKILPKNSIVQIQYLSSAGEDGNINTKYVINTINNTFNKNYTFYCTNFSPIVGGQNYETIDSIKVRAPRYYLFSGPVITKSAYIAAIESIPYVHKANVYSKEYTDPTTNITRDVIVYTAIDYQGNEIKEQDIHTDLLSLIGDRKSPLDVIRYQPPEFLQLALNVKANVSNTGEDLSYLQDFYKTELYNKYNILNQQFKSNFDHSEIIKYLIDLKSATFSSTLKNIQLLTEAVCELKPSKFTQSAILGYFISNFTFPISFVKLKGFDDGVLHCLKIQIYFDCDECKDKSRTIFLVKNLNYNPNTPGSKPYTLLQYNYISDITDYDTMSTSILNPNTYPIPISEDDKINYIPIVVEYDYFHTLHPVGTGTISIPLNMRDSTGAPTSEYYINFLTNDRDTLDKIVKIKVYAQPFYPDIFALNDNDIFKIDLEDIKVKISYLAT